MGLELSAVQERARSLSVASPAKRVSPAVSPYAQMAMDTEGLAESGVRPL